MASITDLDRDALPDLVGHTDRLGVLSIYVDADPAEQSTTSTTWAVAVRTELDALVGRLRDQGPRETWVAVRDTLAALEGEIADLVSPRSSGRGRVMFIAVESGDVWRWSSQLPVQPTVVFEPRPFVSPLVSLLEDAGPVGVVIAHRDGLRLSEIHFGEATDVASFDFSAAQDDWREMKGPAGGNPGLSQQTAPQRDRFEKRVDEHRGRFLVEAAAGVADAARTRGWRAMVVAGDARYTAPVESALPADLTPAVIRVDALLEQLPAKELVDACAPALQEVAARGRAELLERATDAAAAGGRGAVGPADVARALNEGRVAQLLIADGVQLTGYVADDGMLTADDAGEPTPPGVRDDHFGERMIERAVSTSADVVTIGPDDQPAPPGGIAAILRW
jgi:hypothetical protein